MAQEKMTEEEEIAFKKKYGVKEPVAEKSPEKELKKQSFWSKLIGNTAMGRSTAEASGKTGKALKELGQ